MAPRILQSSHNPYLTSLDKIKIIARAWGVSSINKLSELEVRDALLGKVRARQSLTKDGHDKFIEDNNLGEEVQLRGKVTQAVDLNLLRFDLSKMMWYFMDGGKVAKEFCGVVNVDYYREELVEHLQYTEKDLNLLEGSLKKSTQKELVELET